MLLETVLAWPTDLMKAICNVSLTAVGHTCPRGQSHPNIFPMKTRTPPWTIRVDCENYLQSGDSHKLAKANLNQNIRRQQKHLKDQRGIQINITFKGSYLDSHLILAWFIGRCFSSLSRRDPKDHTPWGRHGSHHSRVDGSSFHDKGQSGQTDRRDHTVWKGRLLLDIRTTFPNTPSCTFYL